VNRPLPSLARQTLTDAELLPPRPAEAKTAVATRTDPLLCLKGMRLLPGQACPVKLRSTI